MLKTAKNFGLTWFRSNCSIPVLSTEDLELVKKLLNENPSKSIIGTHSGAFHADEVLSCTLLKFTMRFQDPLIIRSRNPEVHKLTQVLVDVGGSYDPNTLRFDHHQKEFKGGPFLTFRILRRREQNENELCWIDI